MNTLCFMSNLTSAEWAAWVQAGGSILAIAGVAWQTNKQHRNSLALLATERREAQRELAKTLGKLAENCAKVGAYFSNSLKDRESIHNIAEGYNPFDLGELAHLDRAISDIPLYELPSSLVTPTMVLGATVRQFRAHIELAIRQSRKMDASDFRAFFQTLGEMNQSMAKTTADIAREVTTAQTWDGR